jgi:hypothetical protein
MDPDLKKLERRVQRLESLVQRLLDLNPAPVRVTDKLADRVQSFCERVAYIEGMIEAEGLLCAPASPR